MIRITDDMCAKVEEMAQDLGLDAKAKQRLYVHLGQFMQITRDAMMAAMVEQQLRETAVRKLPEPIQPPRFRRWAP